MDTRKRIRNEANANGGFKKSKTEMDSSAIGTKLKPCTKFFSTAGCQFGESCHFLHYVPGGYNAVAQMMNLAPAPGPRTAAPPPMSNGAAPSAVKTKICNRFNTAEGCKFGDKCNFAHGEWELGKAIMPMPSREDPRAMGPGPGRFGRMEPAIPATAGGFGVSTTIKISVDGTLAGAIIGKSGVNSKQICRQTGAKLAIRDHESDPNLKNIELEGTFEQIELASTMVRELIASLRSMGGGGPARPPVMPGGPPSLGNKSNYKTKMCENFTKGACTFGDRCHFAHGAAELRKQGV